MKAHQDRLNVLQQKKFIDFISNEQKHEKLMEKVVTQKEESIARYMRYKLKE